MEMTGEQLIPLRQQRVWEALNDPGILKACIPGCESIEKVSDTEYKVAMTAAIGPVKAKFNGKLLLADLNPPHSYSIAFEGSGGAAGFGKGGAQVSLLPEGSSTRRSSWPDGSTALRDSATARPSSSPSWPSACSSIGTRSRRCSSAPASSRSSRC